MKNLLDDMIFEVLTFAEASDLWNLSDGTLRHAAARGTFTDKEIRKSGSTWLITKEAMKRVYGSNESLW